MSEHARLSPLAQANLLAGHAVSYATAYLRGDHDAVKLGDNAHRLFLDMLVVENAETSSFLIPVQLLAIAMMRIARNAATSHRVDAQAFRDRSERWEAVMGSLVELVCHESRQLKKETA